MVKRWGVSFKRRLYKRSVIRHDHIHSRTNAGWRTLPSLRFIYRLRVEHPRAGYVPFWV